MNRAGHRLLVLVVFALIVVAWVPRTVGAQVREDPARVRAAKLVNLAKGYFRHLSQSEVDMLKAAASGTTAWRGHGTYRGNKAKLENDDRPENAREFSWAVKRSIRAEVVRWLVIDPDAAKLMDPSGIDVGGAFVSGNLQLSDLSIAVPLRFVGCAIPQGVDLAMTRAPVINLNDSVTGPIRANGIVLESNLLLAGGTYDSADLTNAQIKGNLDAFGATFLSQNNDNAAAYLNEAKITGSVVMMHIKTRGFIYLRLAEIGGVLTLENAEFTGKESNGLYAPQAKVKEQLVWTHLKIGPRTELDLDGATVGLFTDDQQSWPAANNLFLNGFVYGEIDPYEWKDLNSRLTWLTLQPPDFHPQPYEALAKFLNSTGQDDEAVDVLIAKQEAFLRLGHSSYLEKVWNRGLGATIMYGYRPLHALRYIVVLVILGWLLFWCGYGIGFVTPTEKDAYKTFMESDPRIPPAGYQRFNSFVYSLESFLPLVDLYQLKYWLPDSRSCKWNPPLLHHEFTLAPGRWLRGYLWIHILAGWFFTTMLVAGLTGLVHK